MGWDEAPPTKDELAKVASPANSPWDSAPPTDNELQAAGVKEKSLKNKILDYQLPFGMSARGLLKGTAEALPTAGMIAGGLVGTPADVIAGPAGTVAGASAGGALGYAAKNAIEGSVLDEPKTRSDLYLDPVKGAAEGAGAEMGGQLMGKAGELIADTKAGKWVAGKASKVFNKLGEAFTGVSEKEIQTYKNHADEIKDMAKSSDNNSFEAANDMREKWNDQLQDKRQELNRTISDALSKSEKTIKIDPIVQSLSSAKAKINPKLYPEEAAQIDTLISKISSMAKDGQVTASEAHEIKEFLQDQAKSAYKPGAVFPLGTKAAKSAKSAAAISRKLVNEAEPLVASANNQLSNLHNIEESMNRNLLKDGQSESSIMAAGSGGNERNATALQRLSDATGGDMKVDAEKLAAMRTFGNPQLTAKDATGKAFARHGLGAISGGLLGYESGGKEGAAVGAGLGAVLSSPAALRVAIDTGQITSQMLKSPAIQQQMNRGLLNSAVQYIQEKRGLISDPQELNNSRMGSK